MRQYRIEKKIGRGGWSEVYLAWDEKLQRSVALKVLAADLADSPERAERARREALAISALSHPHIETIHDLDEMDGRLCLVLEYLPGGTLRQKLAAVREAGQRLTLEEVLRYAVETAEGLAHAHSRGIIHRDIKTSNLMLTAEGSVKIADFGLAKLRAEGSHTKEGALMGTVGYLSPEMAQGIPADERSDVFSYGVVLFELAAGRLPFQGASEGAVLSQVLQAAAPPLREVRGDAPAELSRIVARALEKRREDRYQRMEDLLAELRALQSRLRDRTLPDEQPATISQDGRAQAPARRLRVRRLLLIGLLLAPLLALLWLPLQDWMRRHRLPAEQRLAVLPFRNLSSADIKPELCDGLMDILTHKLTQLEQVRGPLRVFAASDVLNLGVQSAGEARRLLGATLALAVSAHREGDKIILAVSLVDAQTQLQLEVFTIEAPARDFRSMQDSLVQAVADMLHVRLRPEARNRIASGATEVPTAYERYVAGRGELQRSDRLERIARAKDRFLEALDLDPRYALAAAGVAEACYYRYRLTKDTKDLEEARQYAERAAGLDGSLAPVHSTIGLIRTGSGQPDQAVASFERALKLDPLSPEALRGLAAALEAQGSPRAEAAFQRAVALRPNNWVAHRDLGVFYFQHTRYKEAIPSFQRVIELTPDNFRGYSNLGGVYLKLGRRQEARRMFDRSLAIQPTAAAYSNLGTLLFHEGRYAEAAETLEKAVKTTPKDERLWGNLAVARLNAPGLGEKAAEALDQAIALSEARLAVNPKDAWVRANLATYHAFSGRMPSALAEMERALKLMPDDSSVLFRSALVCERAGLRDRALAYLGRAIRSGQSLDEIHAAPMLAQLRRDPRYRRLEQEQTTEQ